MYTALLKEPYQWHPQQTANTPIAQIWRLLMSTEGVWKPIAGRTVLKGKSKPLK